MRRVMRHAGRINQRSQPWRLPLPSPKKPFDPTNRNPFATSLRFKSLGFRLTDHIEGDLRRRKRPKSCEVPAQAGTHGSTSRKYPVRCVISASEGHECSSPRVYGDYVCCIGLCFSRGSHVDRIRPRSSGAAGKEGRRNTGEHDEQNGSHA